MTSSPRLRGRVPYQPQLPSTVRYRPASASQLLAFQYCYYLVPDQALARRKASLPQLAHSHHTTPHSDQSQVPAVAAVSLDPITPWTPCRLPMLLQIPVWSQA